METDDNPGRHGIFGFLRGKNREDDSANTTEEEIISMVEEGHEKGDLQESEAQMIHNIFEFDDKDAKDIMTHRKNIVAVDAQSTLQEVLEFVKYKEYSRYPVYKEEIDDITGMVHIRDLLRFVLNGEKMDEAVSAIPGLVRNVILVPETRHIDLLFHDMQKSKTHMTIVIDEYGQTAGLVTMEDILEEIVGNIMDEYDREEKKILPQPDGSYIMAGDADIEDVYGLLGLQEEQEQEFDTLNGFLVAQMDKIPKEGEAVTIRTHGYTFEVLLVKNNMIASVRVRPQDPDGTQEAQAIKEPDT